MTAKIGALWTHHALLADRTWTGHDIPPEIRALVGDDLACMADDGQLDYGLVLHLTYAATYEWPEPETPEWIEVAIEANPGTWISRLCRARHGRANTYRNIAWCGTCREYSNQRRRRRAAALQVDVLPGFEKIGGAYHLHPPCSRRGLTWLRHQVYRLVRQGRITKLRERRPDMRQPRGWDLMATLYPTDQNTNVERKDGRR